MIVSDIRERFLCHSKNNPPCYVAFPKRNHHYIRTERLF